MKKKEQVAIGLPVRIIAMVEDAAGVQCTDRTEYMRRAIITALKADGFDPGRKVA
jgi:hypothetical protein